MRIQGQGQPQSLGHLVNPIHVIKILAGEEQRLELLWALVWVRGALSECYSHTQQVQALERVLRRFQGKHEGIPNGKLSWVVGPCLSESKGSLYISLSLSWLQCFLGPALASISLFSLIWSEDWLPRRRHPFSPLQPQLPISYHCQCAAQSDEQLSVLIRTF